MFPCIYIRLSVSVYIRLYGDMCVCVCVYVCVCVCVCVCVRTRVHPIRIYSRSYMQMPRQTF